MIGDTLTFQGRLLGDSEARLGSGMMSRSLTKELVKNIMRLCLYGAEMIWRDLCEKWNE